MNSKNKILASIRKQPVREISLPDSNGFGIRYEDPLGQFENMLERVGGVALRVADQAQIAETLESIEVYRSAKWVLNGVPGVQRDNPDEVPVGDPRALEQLDVAVLPGELMVAENGAIWVSTENVKHRVVYVIAEHLILVVDAQQIVHNLHEAYDRLSFEQVQYGLFISGPSKTADIAATLVKGAQGARSLHVLLVGPPPPTPER
ncbi:MAG: hypothetical protein CMJ81_18065 [Planctomycetaceae bacterium]|jgi:L-lactate dehydrogenase complex protein LldG|nr:hypothetical protein [Planctomycetaceae bacterium]MBP63438.1 hypothetical protein [Planctomycetaceae bacterium]